MVPSETEVFPMLDERGFNLGYLYEGCYPLPSLDHIDSRGKP